MPDQRTNQSVAERLELQLDRFPNPLHRCRRWYTLAGGLLPLLLLGVVFARRDHTVFLARPIAESHQHFQDDCHQCHRTPWQPLVRLASANSTARSVRDADCQQCHAQDKTDHNTLAMSKGVPDCADCHQEHRGTIRLTEQADVSCVKCHEPFQDHPQFALLRPWSLEANPTASAAARMRELGEVATLLVSDGDTEPRAGTWVDKGALKFSHEGHLAPLVAKLHRASADATSAPPTQLGCVDCHELDANGQHMQPIVYEQHCRDCHPLRFSSKLDSTAAPTSSGSIQSLPHETPEIVRSVIRQRLIAAAPKYLAESSSPTANSNSTSRLPNRKASTSQQTWDWVNAELRVLENAIFGSPAGDAATASVKNACLKCHEGGVATPVSDVSATDLATFSIVPPQLPKRWMPHSHFRHDRHLNMSCVECHAIPGVDQEGKATAASDDALRTNSVPEILMPTVQTCQACHGATGDDGEPERSVRALRPARKNCTECHTYHHVSNDAGHP